MTVKELFVSEGFDAIMQALQKTHCNDTSIRSIAGYKEAFDIICNTEFQGEGGEVTFDITPKEEWYEPHKLPVLANNVEGDYWKNTVGKTIIKPDYNPFTNAELAGAILWGMTFLGFTKHSMWKMSDEYYTEYGKIAKHLECKLYLPYIRDKEIKQELKNRTTLPFEIAFPIEVWNQIDFRRNHQNRTKRKRFYRINKRINQLKRLDKCQHLIETITTRDVLYDPELKNRIVNAGNLFESWRESHPNKNSTRIDYLIDLLTNYPPDFNYICNIKYNDCEEIFIIAYTSNDTPLTDLEEKRLNELFASTIAKRCIRFTFAKGTDNEIKGEIALQIIGISSTELDNEKE